MTNPFIIQIQNKTMAAQAIKTVIINQTAKAEPHHHHHHQRHRQKAQQKSHANRNIQKCEITAKIQHHRMNMIHRMYPLQRVSVQII